MSPVLKGVAVSAGTALALSPAAKATVTSVGLMLLGSALSFLAALYWFRRSAKMKADQALVDRVGELETQLKMVGQTILPLSAAFQAILVKELTHYHTPVMDALMVKLGPPNTLTEEEEAQLGRLLEERTRDLNGRISDAEREAAVMLPMVMRRVKADTVALTEGPPDLRVVVVPVEPEK